MFTYTPDRNLFEYVVRIRSAVDISATSSECPSEVIALTDLTQLSSLRQMLMEDIQLLEDIESPSPQVDGRFRNLEERVSNRKQIIPFARNARKHTCSPLLNQDADEDALGDEPLCTVDSENKLLRICVPREPGLRAGIGFPLGYAIVCTRCDGHEHWELVPTRLNTELDCYEGRCSLGAHGDIAEIACIALSKHDIETNREFFKLLPNGVITIEDQSGEAELPRQIFDVIERSATGVDLKTPPIHVVYQALSIMPAMALGSTGSPHTTSAPKILPSVKLSTDGWAELYISHDGIAELEYGVVLVRFFVDHNFVCHRLAVPFDDKSHITCSVSVHEEQSIMELVREDGWRERITVQPILESHSIVENLRKSEDKSIFKKFERDYRGLLNADEGSRIKKSIQSLVSALQ